MNALQRRLQASGRYSPALLGTLLLMLPELREISHVLAHEVTVKLQQLIEIRDAMKQVTLETLSPDGGAYEILSDEVVKHICEGYSLEQFEINRRTKQITKKKKIRHRKKKGKANRKDVKPPSINNFKFFKPPGTSSSEGTERQNVVCSIRADVWLSTDDT